MSQLPTIGRIVQYGIGRDHTGAVQYRPAIVVQDWGGNYSEGSGPNLQVFVDGTNDRPEGFSGEPRPEDVFQKGAFPEESFAGVMWRTSVSEGPNVGQWRWPPRD